MDNIELVNSIRENGLFFEGGEINAAKTENVT